MKSKMFWIKGIIFCGGLLIASAGFAKNPADKGCPTCATNKPCSCEEKGCSTDKNDTRELESVVFTLPAGALNPDFSISSASIKLKIEEPSKFAVTPQALRVSVCPYFIKKVVNKKEIVLIANGGSSLRFSVNQGSSIAYPSKSSVGGVQKIRLLDSEKQLTSDSKKLKYYEFLPGNGNNYLFSSASSNGFSLVSMGIKGENLVVTNSGLEIIRTPDTGNVLRQVKTNTRLLDIQTGSTNELKYSIDVYDIEDLTLSKEGTNNFYQIPAGITLVESFVVESPGAISNNFNQVLITRIANPGTATEKTEVSDFEYTPSKREWSLTRDHYFFVRDFKNLDMKNGTNLSERVYGQLNGGAEEIVYRHRVYSAIKTWGDPLTKTEEYISPTKIRTTTYSYYEDSSENGFKKKKRMDRSDGYWEEYTYNTQHLMKTRTQPTANGQKVTSYTYDNDAINLKNDTRPRSIRVEIGGHLVEETSYIYEPDTGSGRVETMTRSTPSGGVSSTVRTYYPSLGGIDVARNQIKQVRYSDGRVTSYSYERGTFPEVPENGGSIPTASDFSPNSSGSYVRTMTVHGTTASSSGVINKSTREVVIKDIKRDVVTRETQVYTGGVGYQTIQWTTFKRDFKGHPVVTYHSDGTREEGVWSLCCGKDSGTDRSGIETAYTYDANKRMISSTKIKSAGDNIITEYEYDAKGRRLATKIEVNGALKAQTSAQYDGLGRVIQSVNQQQLVTTTTFDDSSRVTTVTLPSGATRIVTKYVDGKVKTISGTAVTPEFHEYGVTSDGLLWEKVYYGSTDASSPRWVKTYTDGLWRTVKTERPGFGSSVVLSTRSFYNNKSQLIKTEQYSNTTLLSRTIYQYDELGNKIRQGLDVDLNGSLNLASKDRISDSDSFYEQNGSNWFRTSKSIIYPDGNSATAKTTSVSRTQLTGLGTTSSNGLLVARTQQTDLLGNTTVSSTYIDRDGKKVTQVTDLPTSDIDVTRISINGLVISQTSPTGIQTTFGYDEIERRITQADPRIGTSTNHYNALGKIDWIQDPANNKTQFTYDPQTGQRTIVSRQVTVNGNVETIATTNTYYLNGQVKKVTGGQYPVEYGYDVYGKLKTLKTWKIGRASCRERV